VVSLLDFSVFFNPDGVVGCINNQVGGIGILESARFSVAFSVSASILPVLNDVLDAVSVVGLFGGLEFSGAPAGEGAGVVCDRAPLQIDSCGDSTDEDCGEDEF